MQTIIVVGIPGCGKSSILKETLRQAPKVSIVNYGDKMLEEASQEGLGRDELRKMPIADQYKIGLKAAKKIVKESIGITIVDTHALVRTPFGYIPGLPREVLEALAPRACAWIECSPALILQRRSHDSSRARDVESEEELNLHQELTRDYLSACSMASGAILCRVRNESPSIAENALPLVRLIHSLAI